jgi:hypothetical protein
MRRITRFRPDETAPERCAVLELQSIPRGAEPPARIIDLLELAMDSYLALAEPLALIESIDAETFAGIFTGEGQNESESPIAEIFPRADSLALFAATVGKQVCKRISELFRTNEPALGYMLDSVASAAADRAAELAAAKYLERLRETGSADHNTLVLPYSPGYCGWHISGQRKLFTRLRPDEIGILLNDSFLMIPLKSVSGVLAAGPRELHVHDEIYPSCGGCATHSCRERIAKIMEME